MATIPSDQNVLKKDETYSLISADKVSGTDVYNAQGNQLGEVEDIMIDKLSGKVAYAVIAFGGFLGMGEQRRALPWSVLKYEPRRDGYVVGAADETLKDIPDIGEGAYADPEWGARVHQHFGVPPYWS